MKILHLASVGGILPCSTPVTSFSSMANLFQISWSVFEPIHFNIYDTWRSHSRGQPPLEGSQASKCNAPKELVQRRVLRTIFQRGSAARFPDCLWSCRTTRAWKMWKVRNLQSMLKWQCWYGAEDWELWTILVWEICEPVHHLGWILVWGISHSGQSSIYRQAEGYVHNVGGLMNCPE